MLIVATPDTLQNGGLTANLHDVISSHAVAVAARVGVTVEVPFRCNPEEALDNLTDMLLEYEKISGQRHPVDALLPSLRDSVETSHVGSKPA